MIYQHDSKNGREADEFTYAVQGEGTAVSARAKVTILVRALTSQLEYPRQVALGSIPAGLASKAEIVFVNSGKAEATLDLKAPPWAMLEAGRIRIPASSEARATLSVTPHGSGDLSGFLEIAGDAKGAITLSAEAFAPIEVAPRSLKLGVGNASPLSIKNVSGRTVAVEIGLPNGIVPPGSLTLKADESRDVPLQLAESAPSSAESTASVRAGDFVATIPVAWSKPPASIVFEGATSLKLGELHPDQPVQRTLTLRNAGEQKARVRVTAKDAWIFLPAGGTVFDLRPGQTKTIAVGGIGGGAAGERRGTLVAAWESGTSEVSVEAIVLDQTTPPPVSESAPAEVESQVDRSTGSESAPGMDRAEIAKLVARDRLKILSAESLPGKVHLKWQDPSPEPRTYRIEFRRPAPVGSVGRTAIPPGTKLSAEQLLVSDEKGRASLDGEEAGRVVSVWRELPEANIKQVAPQTSEAILTGLGKGQLLSLRIIPIEANGRRSPVHTLLSIRLKPPLPPWWSGWQVRALAIVCLLTVAGWLIFRGRPVSQISS